MYKYNKNDLDLLAANTDFLPDNLEKVLRLSDILQYMNANPLLSSYLALKGGTAIQTPTEIHIAIPAKNKVLLPDYPPIKLYYWEKRFYETGVMKTTYNGEEITIYDIEKSVCDVIRYRNKVGIDITSEVLRNYLKRKDRNLDKLMKYAENMRIAKVLNQYINVML